MGFCKKCKRDYVLENAKFEEDRYDILEGTWTVKKYDLEKAADCYGGTLGVKWANSVLEDSDMWQDPVIEFAQNILKGNGQKNPVRLSQMVWLSQMMKYLR
jgi:hypothetical protein